MTVLEKNVYWLAYYVHGWIEFILTEELFRK